MFRVVAAAVFGILLIQSTEARTDEIELTSEVVAPDPRSAPVACDTKPGKLVIVMFDGVRWQEIFGGSDPTRAEGPTIIARHLTPNLHALGERGAILGAPGFGTISSSGPNFASFVGYAEMASGHTSPCQVNNCPRLGRETFFDQASEAGASVAVFASWRGIDRISTAHADNAIVRSCGGVGDVRPDPLTTEAALEYYGRVRPDLFYMSLVETDTAAHHGGYDEYLTALHRADDSLGRLVALTDPDTTIFVTTDHGRASNFTDHGPQPESARTWLVAAGPRIPAKGDVVSPRPRHLNNIAPTARVILGLHPDTSEGATEPLDELFAEPALATREVK